MPRKKASSSSSTTTTTKTTTTTSSLIPQKGVLPSYLALAFGDLYEEDGLCVLGKGLGWLTLLASMIRFYADTTELGHMALMRMEQEQQQHQEKEQQEKRYKNDKTAQRQHRPPLVLVLGLQDTEHDILLQMLDSWGTPHEFLPTIITNESGQSKDRASLYRRGGVFCVTSRILIVDFLTGTLLSSQVDGMLVAHAHKVTGDSTEAFIVRIYTTQRRRDTCFIKAFSDVPEGLISGFAQTDKILKALQVRNLYLYPRFHEAIQDELSGGSGNASSEVSPSSSSSSPIDVEEFQIGLSPTMKDIQSAIVAAVKTCMSELKKATPMVEWNMGNDDLRIENCVTSNFDRAVSRQLESDWHRLKPGSKQLVQDLRTLRTLFQYLIQYDCVSFWKLINTIKTMSSSNSGGGGGGGGFRNNQALWLLTPAAQLLFKKAKERIHTIELGKSEKDTTATTANSNSNGGGGSPPNARPVGKLKPVLEENPKWRLLRKVLMEAVRDANSKSRQQRKDGKNDDDDTVLKAPPGPTILVVVKDDRAVDAIRSYLVEGRDRTLALRWLKYLKDYNDRSRSVAGSKISEESRLLLEEESRVSRILGRQNQRQKVNANGKRGRSTDQSHQKKLNQVPSYLKKRRKIAAEKGRGVEMTANSEDRERRAVLDEALEEAEHDLDNLKDNTNRESDNPDDDNLEDSDSDELYDTMFQASFLAEPRIIIKSLSSMDGAAAGMALADLDPDYVILYDFNIEIVRSVEVHAALNTAVDGRRLKVYFLMFEASSEQKVFLKSLEREKTAFEKLIHHKKHMPPPVLHVEGTQEMQQAMATGGVAGTYANGRLPLAADTRRAGGKGKTEKRDVAVDVREFRSALPGILHRGGMRLAPVTLTVGDFVLSNVHCVERKSISDLFGSFASGRLYTQAEAMSKYYACPMLLIEFDPAKSFSLQSEKDLGMDIRTDSVCSKIAILTMHFPKLRILWSKSPHESLRIFKELKQNHEEVDVAKAIEVGRQDTNDALLRPDNSTSGDKDDGNRDEEDEINEAGRDMLLRLPGVTVPIARRIMRECDSLADLIVMNREDLRRLAGPITGQRLFTFFQQQFGAI